MCTTGMVSLNAHLNTKAHARSDKCYLSLFFGPPICGSATLWSRAERSSPPGPRVATAVRNRVRAALSLPRYFAMADYVGLVSGARCHVRKARAICSQGWRPMRDHQKGAAPKPYADRSHISTFEQYCQRKCRRKCTDAAVGASRADARQSPVACFETLLQAIMYWT